MSPASDRPADAKVRIPLRGSAARHGYESESVWAEPLGERRYRLWNVPAFAFNIEMTDVVECEEYPNELPKVLRVVEHGECFGVRLYFSEQAPEDAVNGVLAKVASRRPVIAKCGRRLWTAGFRSVADYEWLGPALAAEIEAGTVTLESIYRTDEPTW